MLVHQHEGPVLVPLVLHPCQGEIGDDVRRVPHVLDDLVVLAVPVRIQPHGGVVVGALSDEDLRVVVSLGGHVRAQVPLADHCGGVACLAQKLGKGLLGPVELVSVDQEAVGMGILAGLDGGPHGPADRVGHVALLEEHAVAGERVDVWRGAVFLEPGVIGSDGLIGMIVGKDEQDVRAFCDR